MYASALRKIAANENPINVFDRPVRLDLKTLCDLWRYSKPKKFWIRLFLICHLEFSAWTQSLGVCFCENSAENAIGLSYR